MKRDDWNIIECDDEMSFPYHNETVLAYSPIEGVGLATHATENKKTTATDPNVPPKHYWMWVNKRKWEGYMTVNNITHWMRIVAP